MDTSFSVKKFLTSFDLALIALPLALLETIVASFIASRLYARTAA